MKKTLHNLFPLQRIMQKLFLLIALLAFTAGINAQITTFPWTETFNSDSPTLSGWTQIYEVNNMSWTFTNDASTGSYDLDPYDGNFANFPADSHNFDTTKLVSPVMDLSGMANITLNFVYVNPFWDPDQNWLTIYYRTSAAAAWVQLAEYHTDIDVWTPSGSISLPNPSATYQIAIECRTDYGWSTLVDQVVVNGTPAVAVTSVDVTTQGSVPATISTAGGTLPLVAIVNPAGASQSVTWSVVSGSGLATVNASGVVTATASGSVTVRATSVSDPTKFDEIVITVAIPAVASVDVATQGNVPATITTPGGTLPLTATVNPAGASQAVTWSVVSGASSATVSASGVVTATASGTVIIRATSVADPTKFDEIEITITLPIVITGVQVTTQGSVPSEITTPGGTLQLVATVLPAGANQNVTWSIVSGSAFASISATGVVTAIADGTAIIRATSVGDPTKSGEIDVIINTVIEVTDIVINTEGNVDAVITTEAGTLQLEAVVNPSGANQAVTWSVVAGAGFASVSASGEVTAIANGIATIQATSVGDPTKTDIIDVLVNFVESVEVSTEGDVPAVITSAGGTLQLEATVNPSGAEQGVTWSIVSGSEFATLSADGLVTAVANGTVTIRATSDVDDAKFDDIVIIISGILGTGDFSINSIKAYPNPVTDVLHISAADAIKTVEVYNMLGQQMTAKAVNGDQGQIDMASFATGNYILKINTDSASKTVKIVKQ